MTNGKQESHLSLLDSVLESTVDGILVVSREGKVIKYNKKFVKLWKVPQSILESGLDTTLINFILDQLEDPNSFVSKVRELYSKPEEESLDYLNFKDGRVFERYSAAYRTDEIILGRVWSFRDITKQKQAENKLIKERILFRTIIDYLPDAIYAKNLEFRKTLANKADVANTGCNSEDEVLGKSDFDYFPLESALSFYNDDKSVIETGIPVMNREESFVDKNGNKTWLLTTKLPLKDTNDKIIGLIGVGRNITIRKKNEMIREALYEISESVLVSSDMNMLYKKIHKVVSNLMYAKNFFIALYDENKNLISFPYMVDEFDEPYKTKPFGKGLTEYIIRTGKPALIDAEMDLELRRQNETELIGTPAAIWLGVPLKDKEKVLGVIVLQDYENPKAYGEDELQLLVFVSDQIANAIARKRDAEEIAKYAAELNELNKTKDKFFSIIAHDLKNPFVTLLGFSEILLSDFKELQSNEVLYYINEMKNSADLSFNLLQNLLQWSRSQTGRIEFFPRKIELLEIVDQNISLLKASSERKGISLVNSIKEGVVITADGDMLNTIIRNLLTNALKFTNKEGRVTIAAEHKDSFVEISVSDTGVGMDQETVNKLFRLDVSHSSFGTDNESGTGLGLILCKEFVEKHKGKIWVSSQLSLGTTFTFSLPKI